MRGDARAFGYYVLEAVGQTPRDESAPTRLEVDTRRRLKAISPATFRRYLRALG